MYKRYLFICMAVPVLFTQGCGFSSSSAGSPENRSTEVRATQADGFAIMAKVADRYRGEDYLLTTAWILTRKGRVLHRARYTEERKNYRGRDDFDFKSVLRYSDPPSRYRKALLTWCYASGRREYWYFLVGFHDARRTFSLQRYRSRAEADFNLEYYVEINLKEEDHTLLKSEEYNDATCYLVENIPRKDRQYYGKRITYIDQQNWIPLKIECFDKKGALWKVLRITWQNISGVWLWKKAEVDNVQDDYKTYIVVEEAKVNTGLPDRDFTKIALDKKK